jgi:tripartite motif-containing protein 71
LSNPWGIGFDQAGNLYVANNAANPGVVVGNGSTYNTVSSVGQFQLAGGLKVDNSNNVYVTDIIGNNIQVYSESGASWTTISGYPGRKPYDVAPDNHGNVFVADYTNNAVYEWNGASWSTFASGAGTGNGQFGNPFGVAVDPQGHVFVADYDNNRVEEFTPAGAYLNQFPTGGGYCREVSTDSAGGFYAAGSSSPVLFAFFYVP